MKVKKSSIVLVIFTLYGANYFIFEKIFFFNEILSLVGLIFLLKNSFNKKLNFRLPQSTIYRSVLLFIFLCLIYALISLWLKTNWYYYFRNLSIIYSVFSFFIGYSLYFHQYDFFKKARQKIYAYFLAATSLRWGLLIDRSSFSILLVLVQKNWKLFSLAVLTAMFFLYTISFTSLTVVIILLFVLAIKYTKSYACFKLQIILLVSGVAFLFAITSPYLSTYRAGGYFLFGNVTHVYSFHPWFWIDPNSSWRLLFWYRLLIENFPQNLIGIGIGTPLIPYQENIFTTELTHNDEYLAHVIGAHNTFVTIFSRFGFLSSIILAVIYRSVFREYILHRKYYSHNKNDESLFLSFVALTGFGLFNLLIESSTVASLYWICLGFVARAIFEREGTVSDNLSPSFFQLPGDKC